MKSILAAASVILLAVTASPVAAALRVGDPAPNFSAQGAQDGMPIAIELGELLKQGPVVLFFFPSAFTDDAESREFAENIDMFTAAGAQVVGVSRDSIETLAKYSRESCDGKFPVASADESLVNAFDVNDGATFNTRTTYVISPSGRIVFVHDANEIRNHVKHSLAFVEGMNN